MAPDTPVTQSEEQDLPARGFLFRLGARVGALVFFVVLFSALWAGLDPGLAFLRAAAALLAIAGCGWLAELATRVSVSEPAVSREDETTATVQES